MGWFGNLSEAQENLSRVPSFTSLAADQGFTGPEADKEYLRNPFGRAISAVPVHGTMQLAVAGKRKKRKRRMQRMSRIMDLQVSSACSQRIGVGNGATNTRTTA